MKPADATRLILLAAIWGASFLFIKLALRDFTSLQVVFLRLATGAGVLVGLVALRRGRLPKGRQLWVPLWIMGAVGNVLPFFLIAWGEQRIPAGLAAILNSTTPLFTAVLAVIFVPNERVNLMRAAGIVLGFVGVAVITDAGGRSASELVAVLAVVVAALAYAVAFVSAARILPKSPGSPLVLSAGQIAAATAITLPFVAFDSVGNLHLPGVVPLLSVLALGALGTGAAYVLYYRLINDVGPTSASLVTYLVPVFGVLLGWLALGETLGLKTLVGAVLVITGVVVSERGARAARSRAEEATKAAA